MFERYKDPRETLLPKLEAGVNREPIFGPLSLRLENRTLCVGENCIPLSPSEYQIFWILVRSQGNIVHFQEIERFLYEDRPEDEDLPMSNTVQVFIMRLQKKLKELTKGEVIISNRYNQGYFLEIKQKNIDF